jgi:hypothetical protein
LQALGASASGRPTKVQISCDVGIRLIAVEFYPQTHGQDARATSEPAVQKSTALRCDFSAGGPYFSDPIFLTFRAFSGQAWVKKMGSEKYRPLDLSAGNSKEAILGAVRWRTGATGGFVYTAD